MSTAEYIDYREVAAIAQKRRHDALPVEYLLSAEKLENVPQDVTYMAQDLNFYTHNEIQIINAEADKILQKVHTKVWTAVEVTEAFCKAATVSQQLTNCLTEILFAEARTQAKSLDDHMARTGQIVGPLHGLPISIKDCFNTPGHPSSIGLSAWANIPMTEDHETLLVKMIRSLGAVAFVKTNSPVAMMMAETVNNVFGSTINPYHRGLSAGGSSGGESALIAFKGSPLGIGTDIGGSIRIPAASCHLYGLRPSLGRFPTFGTRSAIPGQEFVNSVNGPMARSLETLKLYSSAVLSPAMAPWTLDPKCVPIPWRSTTQIHPPGRKLRIAMVGRDDDLVTVHPPVERALNMTRKALEAAGHEIIDWPTDLHAGLAIAMGASFLDFGGTAIMPLLSKHSEPVFPSMNGYRLAAEAASLTGSGLTPDVMRERNSNKWRLSKAYLDRWQATARPAEGKQAIDGIVMAVQPWGAVRNGFTNEENTTMYVGYTGWVNILDLPACTFPVTRADASLDPKRTKFEPLTENDGKIQAEYDPDFYSGAPVGLQLIGERLQEEKVLEVVGMIRDSLVAMDGIAR